MSMKKALLPPSTWLGEHALSLQVADAPACLITFVINTRRMEEDQLVGLQMCRDDRHDVA